MCVCVCVCVWMWVTGEEGKGKRMRISHIEVSVCANKRCRPIRHSHWRLCEVYLTVSVVSGRDTHTN